MEINITENTTYDDFEYYILDLEIPNFTYNRRIYKTDNKHEIGFDFSDKKLLIFKDDNILEYNKISKKAKEEYLELNKEFFTLINANKFSENAQKVYNILQNYLLQYEN